MDQTSTALDQPSSSSLQKIKTSIKFFNKLVGNQQAPNTRADSSAIKAEEHSPRDTSRGQIRS